MHEVSADNMWEAFVAFCRLSATAGLQEKKLLPGRFRLSAGVRKAQSGCFCFAATLQVQLAWGASGRTCKRAKHNLSQASTQTQQANNKHAEGRSRFRVHCSLVALTVEVGMSVLLLVVNVLATLSRQTQRKKYSGLNAFV